MIKPLNDSTIEYYKRLVDVDMTESDYDSELDGDDDFYIDPDITIH